MTTKREAKKRKRNKKKKNKRQMKSPQARFIDKVKDSTSFPVSGVIVDPEGQAKMSEVILDFAKPLLDECKDDESIAKATGLAILIWNLSLLPQSDLDREIEKVCAGLSNSDDARDSAALMDYANLLLERKKKYYADNKRTIINYHISGSGKDLRLDVASTLSR